MRADELLAGPGRGTPQGLRLARLADGALAAFVVLLVGMMVVPLPTPLLDVLLASNVSIAVLVLLVALHLRDGLAFSAFPTLLLVTTLYRLALNVSSTRLILLQADAGSVIRAFGDFVVRGNYVVGAIVFLLLTLVQFLVIAKGGERVAEVAARFTLDAMPGKQMSIDAELRAGGIGQDEARRRRRLLQRESELYGAMDGAMKFVKGDAIAGIVITVVNLVGGLAVGVGLRGMGLGESLELYGLLTIGDGLVSQIPALLISTAAGIVVTRVASEEDGTSLGAEVGRQVFGDARSLRIAAGFLGALAVVPGLPAAPFLVLAAVFLFTGAAVDRRERTAAGPLEAATRKEADRESRARQERVPVVTPVGVELGPGLAARLLDGAGGGPLLDRELPALREALFRDLGVALPGVRVRAAEALGERQYVLEVQEIPVAEATLPEGRSLALAPPGAVAAAGVEGLPGVDPATGATATWIDDRDAPRLEGRAEVLDAAGVVARHLGAVARRRAAGFVGLQEVQTLLDQLERVYPALVRHVVPKPVPLPLLADVLRRLVEEGVSIRPLREILEALATHAGQERDPLVLAERARTALARPLTHQVAVGGVVPALLLDREVEEAVRDAIQRLPGGSFLALSPALAREVIAAAQGAVARARSAGIPRPVVLTQGDVRRFVRRLLEVDLPDTAVVAFGEIVPEVRVEPVGRVGLGAPPA